MKTIEPPLGKMLYPCIQYAIQAARNTTEGIVSMKFNGIELHISYNSNPADIGLIYSLLCQIERMKTGRE